MSENEYGVTFVVTSCNRPDLLKRTMDSFLLHNSAPIARFILVEDSADAEMHAWLKREYGHVFDELILNESRLGQIRSIDRAYARVETPYIFHCEDDFEFLRPGFVEESCSVLRHDDSVINVWLRNLWDIKNHVPSARIERTSDEDVMFRYLSPRWPQGSWFGFTFNPSLRRTADYARIAPFEAIGRELEINEKYKTLGYRAAVLEEGALRHIGVGRHVTDTNESIWSRIRRRSKERRRRRHERKRAQTGRVH